MSEVVDGDTIRVVKEDGFELTVQLLGIDAPEVEPLQCGASQAVAQLLALTFPTPADTDADGILDDQVEELGAYVVLTAEPGQGLYDRDRQALAYVRVLAEASVPGPVDLGSRMLSAGWATVVEDERRGPFARLDRYLEAENSAAAAAAGVHGACGGDFHRDEPPARASARP